MSKRWYVVHAYSGFEKRVASALKERVQRFGMEEKFGESWCPRRKSSRCGAARSVAASASSFRAMCWSNDS
jgi:transcription antitermination factor NusG